jgi:aspartyl-tRNA(Asn)/glutamyl-tRNA(Gln) amidotransferase subunit C
MALDREAVLHIARLARIHLTDAEVDTYAMQLGDIIGHFNVLDGVNTDGVEPTTQALPLRNVLADDVAGSSLGREQVLSLAPNTEDGYLRVRAVLE